MELGVTSGLWRAVCSAVCEVGDASPSWPWVSSEHGALHLGLCPAMWLSRRSGGWSLVHLGHQEAYRGNFI